MSWEDILKRISNNFISSVKTELISPSTTDPKSPPPNEKWVKYVNRHGESLAGDFWDILHNIPNFNIKEIEGEEGDYNWQSNAKSSKAWNQFTIDVRGEYGMDRGNQEYQYGLDFRR